MESPDAYTHAGDRPSPSRVPVKSGVHAWSVGDQLTHRFNAELGTGRVTAIEGRVLVVHSRRPATTLRLAANSDALVPETEASRRRDRTLLERLAAGDVDATEDFLTRLDILHLLATREAAASDRSSAGASGCSRISCTSPSGRPRGCRCGGCSPTRWGWARRSKRR